MMLATKLFDYELPEKLIAQYPAARRDASRMLVMDRQSGDCEIRPFTDIVDFLEPGDGLVFNDTRVMSARMYGLKNGTPGSAEIELLLIAPLDEARQTWNALLKPGKRVRPGTRIGLLYRDGKLNVGDDWAEVIEKRGDGTYVIRFDSAGHDRLQELYGHMPLPPYIRRRDENDDLERYQTIFAREQGAVAAPTAGLHFSPEILRAVAAKGVFQAAVTLHVGPGTFRPVSVENALEHKMHRENFSLSAQAAATINTVHRTGRKILAVGTTTVRVLESCVRGREVIAQTGGTDIFLHPPYRPRAVEMLLTNFHLPKSTLLMLVSTFADREKILNAYEMAKKAEMRFYSYGDCMLLK
ncbi:MAG: tRNA preQ1(34) S-adenosylmethionine ribosyltransferase-isomerase QueA [Victivallaceae bacterium]|nr:tRNA preQ1(34) S-adenosylmethionine ribosyltransferase-isomerase QueA [Victivallaceae bacterium]